MRTMQGTSVFVQVTSIVPLVTYNKRTVHDRYWQRICFSSFDYLVYQWNSVYRIRERINNHTILIRAFFVRALSRSSFPFLLKASLLIRTMTLSIIHTSGSPTVIPPRKERYELPSGIRNTGDISYTADAGRKSTCLSIQELQIESSEARITWRGLIFECDHAVSTVST